MATPSYAWFYDSPFHTAFSASTTILSAVSNGLLLYIIRTTPCQSIGSYRYLLAVFAVCDILTSFAHTALQPIMHLTSSGLFFFPRNGPLIIRGKSYETVLVLAFVAIFYQTFLILAFHFVYRCKIVTSGFAPSLADSWRRSHWIILAVTVNIIYVSYFIATCCIAYVPTDETRALIPSEIEEIYGIDLHNPNRGFIIMAIRRFDAANGKEMLHFPSVVAIFLLLAMFSGTGSVIVYCIWQITSVIRSPISHLSAKTRTMQQNLFNSLLIQSAVPMLFSYFPLATILVYPALTAKALGDFGNVLFSITSIFPSIDAFFVLFFIGRFRTAVIRLVRLPLDTNISPSVEERPSNFTMRMSTVLPRNN